MKKLNLLVSLLLALLCQEIQAQTYVYPEDTLVNPSFFSNNNLVVSWKEGFCAIDIELGPGGPDTVFAPCYKVTYLDHYRASSDLCPPNLGEVGGIGSYFDKPYLLDSNLFRLMENDGNDIINNTNLWDINYENLTTGEEIDGGSGGMGSGPLRYCIEAELFEDSLEVGVDPWIQSFEILMGPIFESEPVALNQSEYIGLTTDGTLIEGDPPSLNGHIIALDRCGWHPEPSGFGHFHSIPGAINIPMNTSGIDSDYQCADVPQNNDGIIGFSFEGIPIYGPYEHGTSSVASDLDGCNGHFGTTGDFPDGAYHYHSSATEIFNYPPCRVGKKAFDSFTYGVNEEEEEQEEKEEDVLSTSKTVVEDNEALSIYPNPTNGLITIKGPVDYYIIYDINGHIILSGLQSLEEQLDLNLSDLESGVYFISAERKRTVFFEKIILK